MFVLKVLAFGLWSAVMVSGCAHTGETGEPVLPVRLEAGHLDGSALGEFKGDERSPMLRRGHQSFESKDTKFRIGIWEALEGPPSSLAHVYNVSGKTGCPEAQRATGK